MPHLLGSDHLPLVTTIRLPAPPPPACPPHTSPVPAKLVAQPRLQPALYASAASHAMQEGMQRALRCLPDTNAAYTCIAALLHAHGVEAGAAIQQRQIPPHRHSAQQRNVHAHQPWFDAACRQALARKRAAERASGGCRTHQVAVLQHAYERLCRSKKRMYKKAAGWRLANYAKHNPTRLWQTLRGPPAKGPCPADLHHCRAHFSQTFNPVPVPPQQAVHEPAAGHSAATPPAPAAPSCTLPTPACDPLPTQQQQQQQQQQQHCSLGSLLDDSDEPHNMSITTDEVIDALKSVKNNRSPGMDGLPAELLKYACPRSQERKLLFHLNPLAPHIAAFFSHVLANGTPPAAWAATLVTLLLKKGDPTDWGNYRPVAMVPLLAKLFTMLLNSRVVAWAEAQGIRSPAQAGFRPGRGTAQQAFVLEHIVSDYRRRRKKLYCCFVDLAKAYDSVPRDLLWQRLYDVGLRGRMLHTIKALYDVGVDMHIQTPFGTLDPIRATVGVKQGCPLSPTLFGLYIDGLHSHVAAQCPAIGPTLTTAPHLRLSLLMYADDCVVMAESASQLQALMSCVDEWCCMKGMTISVKKSEVVVFNATRAAARQTSIIVQGKRLPVRDAFKYLGVWFHRTKGTAHHVQKAADRGKFAIACMNRRLAGMAVGSNVALSLTLYQSLVLPAMLYGCEVWGPALLGTADPATNASPPELVHRNFVKFTLRMRSRTKAWVAFREAGMYPLQYSCFHRMLSFLDSVLEMDDGEYAKVAMLDCIHHANAGCMNWFGRLLRLAKHCAGGSMPAAAVLADGTAVDVEQCLLLWRKFQYRTVWGNLHHDPRTAPSENITLCTYHRYFATDLPEDSSVWSCAPCISAANIPYHQLISLISLRTNSHNLNIERMRQSRPRVPRAHRLCPWCHAAGQVQDELHCILECPHVAHLRLQYPLLFGAETAARDMRSLFTDETLTCALASFVHRALNASGSERLDNADGVDVAQ